MRKKKNQIVVIHLKVCLVRYTTCLKLRNTRPTTYLILSAHPHKFCKLLLLLVWVIVMETSNIYIKEGSSSSSR